MSDQPVIPKEDFVEILSKSYEENVKTESLVQENKKYLAEIQNKKLKLQKQQMDKIETIQGSIEKEDILGRKFDRNKMLKDIEDREKAVIFINGRISNHIIAAPGSLIVIPSMTNNGKSTLVAHIAEALIAEGKKVLVLSNEETEQDVRARVSCLRMKISFGDYKTSKCTPEQKEIILDDSELMSNTNMLTVIAASNGDIDAYRTTTVNGVISTMKAVNGKVDAVILDYYTNVNVSEFGSVDPWHVNNELATQLNILKGNVSYPIIATAQCESIRTDKKAEDKGSIDYDSNHPVYRWKGGKSIVTYATDVIELVRDFDNSCSFLFAHKLRFSHGDVERLHMLPFDKKMQRFIEWSPEFDLGVMRSRMTKETAEKSKEIGLDRLFNGSNE
jgi:KaiC/GvpD/RAD55 family RecA-like ATPase